MIQYRKGNIFESGSDVIVNTVNCKGVMGAGLALQFKKKYPDMFREYQRDCAAGRIRVGRVKLEITSILGNLDCIVILYQP